MKIQILFATETGNAQAIAEDASSRLEAVGHGAQVSDIEDLSLSDLADVDLCLIAASTWGEGDPPMAAEAFYDQLKAADPATLSGVRYAVYALGDTAYENFCKFGHDMDEGFERAGAQRIVPLVENDVDYEENFDPWIESVLQHLASSVTPLST